MTSRETMQRILVAEPELNAHGFGAYDEQHKSREQAAAEIQAGREGMLTEGELERFEMARAWLRRFTKTKGFPRDFSSYGLKHVAEWDIGYTTNGLFIAAAIAEGFPVKRIATPGWWPSPNAWIGIRIGKRERATRRGDGSWWNGRIWCDAVELTRLHKPAGW
jgi:hypothetical protein